MQNLIISLLMLSCFLALSSCEKVSSSSSRVGGSERLSQEQRRENLAGSSSNKKVFDTSDEEHRRHHLKHHGLPSGLYDVSRMIEYFEKNPVTKREKECFSQLKGGQSIDFVIDLAPSPYMDKMDKMSAHAPIGVFLEEEAHPAGKSRFGSVNPTRSYFDYISLFIDIVTCGMKPELTKTVIVDGDKHEKFYLRGRNVEAPLADRKLGGEFSDKTRNIKTLWPVATKSYPETMMSKILDNNLGRMTKLALYNRDNGLPTVLNASRRSKPVYTIVLTDGWSGAKLRDLVEGDLSAVTVIDLGNQRFIERLSREEFDLIRGGIYSVIAPQTLPSFVSSVRNMACWFAGSGSSASSSSSTSSAHLHSVSAGSLAGEQSHRI